MNHVEADENDSSVLVNIPLYRAYCPKSLTGRDVRRDIYFQGSDSGAHTPVCQQQTQAYTPAVKKKLCSFEGAVQEYKL